MVYRFALPWAGVGAIRRAGVHLALAIIDLRICPPPDALPLLDTGSLVKSFDPFAGPISAIEGTLVGFGTLKPTGAADTTQCRHARTIAEIRRSATSRRTNVQKCIVHYVATCRLAP